jgi:hypothetical protein
MLISCAIPCVPFVKGMVKSAHRTLSDEDLTNDIYIFPESYGAQFGVTVLGLLVSGMISSPSTCANFAGNGSIGPSKNALKGAVRKYALRKHG